MQHVTNHVATVHTVSSSFWPSTLGAWAAIVAALLGAVASVLAGSNHGRIAVVRDLVNGNLKSILNDMEYLRKIGTLPARRSMDKVHSEPPPPPDDPSTTSAPIVK
jgi:hypothetical protein